MSNQPYIEEAKRRMEECRRESNRHGFLDEEIITLMADYAAESWQEGYDEGYREGYDAGCSDGYGSGAGW